MAGEIIGGAFFSTLFGKLFDKLGSVEFRDFFTESKINARLLKKLEMTLLSAEQLYNDAEEKQFGNPSARKWLFELKDAICAAEELLDLINYETLRYEHEAKSGTGSSLGERLKLSFSGSSRRFDEEIEEIRDALEHIMKQKKYYGIKEGVKERTLFRLPAPLVDESGVFGRNDVKEKIVSQLMLDDTDGDKITVIPIVGMGGIGKTTLAQLIYEDKRVGDHFDVRAWATVSDEFDVLKITRSIFKDITSKGSESDSLDRLRCKLKEVLTEKKFLIVLDDVWNEKYEPWDVLMSHFQSGAFGSKIIVTTRSDNVVKLMGNVPTHNLEELSDDACWSLFAERIFGNIDSDSYEDLLEIGRKIVKKCKGLPLAVKALAGLLRSVTDREEWQKILTNDIWELHLQENKSNYILPSLWLSYYYLPSHLKCCFVYCSIFPKGYEITEVEKEKIVLLWMAEGLLQPSQRGRATDIVDEYFQELISRSLFQRSSKDKSIIVMHDCVHDLAVFLSGEFCFRLYENDKTKPSCKTRHLSFPQFGIFQNFEGLTTTNSLRTCVRLPLSTYWDQPVISVGGCLRSLCVSSVEAFLDSIGNLKLLRYLDLSGTYIEQIPNILCSFYYLQTLRLSRCQNLTELPIDMGNLVNLCHLDIEDVPLHRMPPRLCNLKDLQTLCQFVLCKSDCSSIKELGSLHRLSGKLAILNLQNLNDDRDAWEANLKEKRYLKMIEYRWSSDGGVVASQKERNALDALQPHVNVERLVISGYSGNEFSNWVGHTSYANLVTVTISSCNSCMLPPLGQLASLQMLFISRCYSVIEIGNEFYRESSSEIRPFRSLKVLEFEVMPVWKKWSFLEEQEYGGCFPSLEELRIFDCPKLDICFSVFFSSLKTVDIQSNKQTDGLLQESQQMGMAFPSLELIRISCCFGLELFQLGNFALNTKDIHLYGCTVDTSVRDDKYPLSLYARGCENMMTFPEVEARLPTNITFIFIDGFQKLKSMNVEGFQHLTSLVHMRIEDCRELQRFPGEMLPTSLTSLSIEAVPKLKDLGKGFQHLTSLTHLAIGYCPSLGCFPNEMLPTSITSLSIKKVPMLKDLGRGFQHLVCLENMEISGCKNLQQLTEEGLPVSLTSLSISFLPNLKYLCRSTQGLISLETLSLYYCEDLERLVREDGRGFRHLVSLKELSISECEKLQWLLEEEGLPTTLTSLRIDGFPNLEDLSPIGIQHLVSLKSLTIVYCKNLQSLPGECLPSNLLYLHMLECRLLEERCSTETGRYWNKIAHIPDLRIGWY